jgi:hypothetical protein
VVLEGIWWHRFHPGGWGVNTLTDDRVTDMGGGPALHSNLVEVALLGAGLLGVTFARRLRRFDD